MNSTSKSRGATGRKTTQTSFIDIDDKYDLPKSRSNAA